MGYEVFYKGADGERFRGFFVVVRDKRKWR
jgi:hypothetical protein